MKTKNRVRRNPAAKPLAGQRPKTAKVHFCSPTSDQVSARVDFPPEEFAVIKAGAKTLGLNPREFLEDVVRAGVASAKDELAHAARPKLTDEQARRRIEGDEEWVTVRLSRQMRRHLRAYGRSVFHGANGDLDILSASVLKIAMMHREFIEAAACKFVRYAEAEGFGEDQARLHESLLMAR